MRESLWQQLKRFPNWHQHEWLGASLMGLGAIYMILGVILLAR